MTEKQEDSDKIPTSSKLISVIFFILNRFNIQKRFESNKIQDILNQIQSRQHQTDKRMPDIVRVAVNNVARRESICLV